MSYNLLLIGERTLELALIRTQIFLSIKFLTVHVKNFIVEKFMVEKFMVEEFTWLKSS